MSAGDLTPGKRVNLPGDDYHLLQAGEYMKGHHTWWGHCPGPDDLNCNLSAHQIVEHEDGTITVSPSILCTDGKAGHSWHGYLERGVWREV